jgi:CheY-like chemotaxis protein
MTTATNPDQGEPAPRRDGSSLRVLVVEDEPDAAESLRQLLVLYGHRAEVARDGSAALTLAERFRPDVVFLDIGLPGKVDGLEVARRLGARQEDGRTPLLVAVTGRGHPDDRRVSELAGIHLHVVKPADPEVLRVLLERFKAITC